MRKRSTVPIEQGPQLGHTISTPMCVRHASQQHLPFHFGLWQSGALLWMGSPLVDGTCTSVASLPNDNFRPLIVSSKTTPALRGGVLSECQAKLCERIETDSSGGNTT